MREIVIPDNVRDFVTEQYSLTLPPSVIFPHAIGDRETGGVLTLQDSVAAIVELPNEVKYKSQYSPDMTALAALGDVPILGVWHTHYNYRGPSKRDKSAAKFWADDEEVPLMLIVGPRREWWLLPDWGK